jgi:hypothetical protein
MRLQILLHFELPVTGWPARTLWCCTEMQALLYCIHHGAYALQLSCAMLAIQLLLQVH